MAAAHRPGSTRAAAKQRRQMVFLVVLLAVLAALAAFEGPRLLKRSNAVGPAASAVAVASPISGVKKWQGAGADPFRGNPLPNQDARPNKGGGPDPFKGGQIIVPPRLIPGQIVIGKPGGHRVATHGWIVILASIPTRNGHARAVQFARSARGRVDSLSILNSSNRRPLRGGYWVVYTGPYKTLGAATQRAGSVHASGYESAYLRELITYR